jgi:hypothetical protein
VEVALHRLFYSLYGASLAIISVQKCYNILLKGMSIMISFGVISTPETNPAIMHIINEFVSLGWVLIQTKTVQKDPENISHLLVWPSVNLEPKWPESIQQLQTEDEDYTEILSCVKPGTKTPTYN